MEQARIFAAAGVALALSFALTPLAIRLAPRVGAVDVPCDGRRMHITPMPRLGGLAIFFAFLIPSALLGMAQETLSRWLLGATLLVLLGILDDVFRLPALVKLVFQILASVIAVSGSGIAQLNLWSMSVSLGAWRAPLSVVWLLACINALLRRQGNQVDELAFGNTTLDLSATMLVCGQNSVRLSAREFDVMRFLLQSKERNLSKEVILARVWGFDSNAVENHVEVYVGFLRKKLAAIGSNVRIVAVRRLGYHLEVAE